MKNINLKNFKLAIKQQKKFLENTDITISPKEAMKLACKAFPIITNNPFKI